MQIVIANGWILFCIAFTIILVTTFIMSLQARNFFTNDVVLRKFSMIDLQLPSSVKDLQNIIKGIYALPPGKQQRTISSLKGHLYVNFLFMPAAYGAIFMLCMKVSGKMTLGAIVFAVLAWLQIIAFIFDIIENVYILNKIHPGIIATGEASHKAYLKMEIMKWGIPLAGVICSLSAIIYFWLVGRYSIESLKYLLILIAEIIIFFIALSIAKKNKIEDDISNS